jgi:hypothetical protein
MYKAFLSFFSRSSTRNEFVIILTNSHRRNWFHRRRNRCLGPSISYWPREGTTQKHYIANAKWYFAHRHWVYQLGREFRNGYPHHRTTPASSSMVLCSFLHSLTCTMGRTK